MERVYNEQMFLFYSISVQCFIKVTVTVTLKSQTTLFSLQEVKIYREQDFFFKKAGNRWILNNPLLPWPNHFRFDFRSLLRGRWGTEGYQDEYNSNACLRESSLTEISKADGSSAKRWGGFHTPAKTLSPQARFLLSDLPDGGSF